MRLPRSVLSLRLGRRGAALAGVASVLGLALGAAMPASPARADEVVLPEAIGGVVFTGFRDFDGPVNDDCQGFFTPVGSSTCDEPVFYAGGPLGPGDHVTGEATGTGTTSVTPSGAPTATTQLTVAGGDSIDGRPETGAGANSATTTLQYYVLVAPLEAPPIAVTSIPLTFADTGSVTGSASSIDFVSGEAETYVHAFQGTVDGGFGDIAQDGESGASLSASYDETHSVVFHFDEEKTPIAEVDLTAYCSFGSDMAGFGGGNCTATADPFVGFDQAAFDALMGANTFELSDFFQIVLSPGLGAAAVPPPPGTPEPASISLVGAGLAGIGWMRRRRKI